MNFKKMLVALATLFIVAFSLQVYLYVNRGTLQSIFTAASEDQLYAVSPNVTNITHLGDGKIRIDLDKKIDALSAVASGKGAAIHVLGDAVEVQLAPGISEVQLRLLDRQEKLTFEYTTQETYITGGLNAFPHGVVGLRSTTMPIGQPVLRDIADWAPTPTPTPTPTLKEWQLAEFEIISFLDVKRGVPNDAAENASSEKLTNLIENNSSQVWCTQIARYMVDKLADQNAVRLLGAGGELSFGEIRTGGHTFLEVLDPVSNRWVFSDPTSYVIGVYWQDGMPVNAAEFQRLLSLYDQTMLKNIQFVVADISLKKMIHLNWLQMPSQIKEDWIFYFSKRNRIYYYAGESSAHDKSLFSKVLDWIRTDRRFILSPPSALPVLAIMRVWSFWIMLLSAMAFTAGVFGKLYSNKRNKVNS